MKALTVKKFSYNPAASENFTTLDKTLVRGGIRIYF